MVTNTDGPSLAYLTEASNFVKSLEPKTSKYTAAQILLVKSIVSTLHNSSSKSYISSINVDEIVRKLERQVHTSLTRFASENKQTDLAAEDESTILSLSITLSGAACIADAYEERRIELTDKTIHQLESISTSYMSKKVHIGWKLRAFLFRNHPDRYDLLGLFTQLEQASTTVDEDVVYDLVDAFVKNRGQPVRGRLLGELIGSGKLAGGAIGPLLAVRRLVELRHGEFSYN